MRSLRAALWAALRADFKGGFTGGFMGGLYGRTLRAEVTGGWFGWRVWPDDLQSGRRLLGAWAVFDLDVSPAK